MSNTTIFGKVIRGEAVGRTINFPTANLALARIPKIKSGVYAALVTLDKKNYLGLAYYGPRYIFNQQQDSFEVFIFNFKQNIYGKTLKIKLLKFLRAPRKVNNLKELKQLLEQDLQRLDQDVILVNRQDKIIGIADKIAAHKGKAKLHRAISVQLKNHQGEWLVQRRATAKHLFPGYWANTVCTDVRPHETYLMAAERRLKEEFGLTAKLKPGSKFYYSAQWQQKAEKEIDQIFIGKALSLPKPNLAEISDWKFIQPELIKNKLTPLAPWFKLILKKISAI